MSNNQMNFADAINLALDHEMEQDENVVVYGLDVSDHKSILGTTKNLVEKYGPSRCFSTPVAEDSMTGAAIGMALNGLRPVHTHIRVDFTLLAVNQLINMASTIRYVSRGKVKVPIVVRAMIGRGWGQGPQHSKSMQSLFTHIPGLKVVMPTKPQDAYSLLRAAIRDDDPVIFLEHRWSHYATGTVDLGKQVALGKAEVLREGNDITILSTSWMGVEALKAAEVLQEYGVSAEVVDVKTLLPLDKKTLINSVAKTKNCIVADYDWVFSGYSAELASTVYENCFKELNRPIERVGFCFSPCPTAVQLEEKFYPSAKDIIKSAEKILSLDPIDVENVDSYSHFVRFKGPF